MTSQLFAFQVAKPIDYAASEPISMIYNPEAQVAEWEGSEQVKALLICTVLQFGYNSCTTYGNYCDAWGGSGGTRPGYRCENI